MGSLVPSRLRRSAAAGDEFVESEDDEVVTKSEQKLDKEIFGSLLDEH